MKHLLTLLCIILFTLSSLFINAQIIVRSGSNQINDFSFCSTSTETLSVQFEESQDGGGAWINQFPDATGNIITLNLNNSFTFGNNSTNAVTFTNSGDITNISVSYTSTVITITFDHTGANVDFIKFENIIINAPSGNGDITANFNVNSCLYSASVAQNKTVTLTSTAPTLAISGAPYCYSPTAQNISFTYTGSCTPLIMQKKDEGTWGNIETDFTSGSSVSLLLDDIVRVKTPAGRISNEITIDASYFKPLTLNMPDEYYCAGEDIEFTLGNYDCFSDSKYSMEIWFGTESGSLTMKETMENVSQTFTYTPEDNGFLQVKIFEGNELIITSEELPVDKILKLDNTYTLSQDIRLSANQQPHNMFNELIPLEGGNFSYTDTKTFEIPGYNNNWEYFYLHQNGDDTLVGRFKFDYKPNINSAYRIFDPEDAVAGGTGNLVTFYYGKYFKVANTFCMQTTSTNVKVDRNKIFVERESFCSYDTKAYDVVIDVTKLPKLDVGENQETIITYKGYTINHLNAASNNLESGKEFTIKPSEWKMDNLSAVEIKAYVDVKIREIKPDCPDLWQEYPPGYSHAESPYKRLDQVVYGPNLYECNVDGTMARPGLSSDWDFITRCFLEDPDFPYDPVVIKANNQTDYINNSETIKTETVSKSYGNCIDKPTWLPTLEAPNYNIGNRVIFNGDIYECIKTAYPNHRPNEFPAIWDNKGPCADVGETVSEFELEYASTVFYVHAPKTDGKILNLDTKYCPSKDSILLESNYKLHGVSGDGVSTVTQNENEYFYYSFGKAYDAGKNKDTLFVYYEDNNGCISQTADLVFTTIDNNYAVDISGVIYWKNEENLEILDNNFCINSFDFELATKSNLSIDTIIGSGIYKDENRYYFNPGTITGAADAAINLYYTDNITQCPYTYSHPIDISAEHVDSSSGLLLLDSSYCVVNKDFELKTLNSHAFDSIQGLGIAGATINDLTYNPFNALENNGGFAYSPDTLIDSVKVYFYDNRNCRYEKKYPTAIVAPKANQTGGLINFDNEYCKYGDSIELASSFTIDSIVATGIYQGTGNKWFLNPSHDDFITNTSDEEVSVKYYYKDGNNCAWYKDYNFDMYSRPHAAFSIDNSTLCFNDSTAFINESTFDTNSGSSIVSWEWDFGNGLKLANPAGVTEINKPLHDGRTLGSYISPQHVYKNHGVYPLTMKLTTDKGCYHTAHDTVIVGDYPQIGFNHDGLVHGYPMLFANTTTSPDYDKVVTYTWDFDDPENAYSSQNNMDSLISYTFNQEGVHNVSLTAITHNDCLSDTLVKIPVFPYIIVDNNSNYVETFNNGQTGWLPAHSFNKGLPSGWELTPVDGAFNKYPNTGGNLWLTGAPAKNVANEQSWVESPAFNIDNLDFPLLSLDVFQSVEKGRDGAVVQYTVDDGKTWNLLTNGPVLEGGINWYNQTGVVSNPGNQSGTGNLGWSANTKQWQTARFPLDHVRQEAKAANALSVRFRVAYSSDGGNVEGEGLSGFAFDNFMISSRTRVVMMEQFVNTAENKALQEQEEEWLDAFVDANPVEVVDMRYHNYISHSYDPLYYISPLDISARSMEYGAFVEQLTMVDGIHRCVAGAEEEAKSYYNTRVLTDKRFDIKVETSTDEQKLTINAQITKLTDTLVTEGTEKCGVRMALVQHEYDYNGEVFRNVMVELLPNGEGNVVESIPADFPKGETMEVTGTWEPNVTTVGNTFRLVVYVQGIWGVDEIHQVWFKDSVDVPQVYGNALGIAGSENEMADFTIYPSPVKDKLNVNWSQQLKTPVHWRLVSVSGSVAKEGTTPAGQSKQIINTSDLDNGMYIFVSLNESNTRVEKRKVLIMK